MKKLVAILLTCMTVTCAAASCGKSDNSSDASSSSKIGYEDNDDDLTGSSKKDDTSKSSETDDDDSSESSKLDDDELASKSSKTDDDDSSKSSSVDLNGAIDTNLIGKWQLLDDEDEIVITFGFDNTLGMSGGFTENLRFEGEDLYLDDEKIDVDSIDFDGSVITVNRNGAVFLKLTSRRDGKGTAKYDGIYRVSSGVLGDTFKENIGSNSMDIEFRDGKSFLYINDLGQYAAKDGIMTFSGENVSGFFGTDEGETATYEVSGNTLTIVGSSGYTDKLERVK